MFSLLIKRTTLLTVFFGLFLLMPGIAKADMTNNLTNQACITCHQNYPAIKQGTTYIVKHKWDKCSTCHTKMALDSMWNCRFCHLEQKFKGGNSYWLHSSPTLSEGMNRHSWDSSLNSVTANFIYHNSSLATKHTSSVDAGCLDCHKSSLTEEHSGGTALIKEDFEDTNYNLNLSGSWYRYSTYPFAGVGSFRSAVIGDNTSTSTEASVYLNQTGKVSFWYRVSSEADYDKFYFYLDGVEKLGGISGNIGWYQVTYPLTPGSHNLKWSYMKDQAVKWFDDCVSIDDVTISGGGYPGDCNTCHLNAQANVKDAIATNNTNCSACHGNVNHELVHASGINQSCQGAGCHSPYLSTDHQQKGSNCASCHSTTNPKFERSMKQKNKDCGSCHSSGHNIDLAPLVKDLPLFEGYQWSNPVSLSVWKGEEWFPAEMAADGYLLVSNRRTDVSPDAVWLFYKAELSQLGWILQSAEPSPGSTEFKVKYTKNENTCWLWLNSLEDHSRPLPVEEGSRIEIIYN